MAFKRKRFARKRRPIRRRRFNRRKVMNKPSRMVFKPKNSLGVLVPDRYFLKMKWSDMFTLTNSSGVASQNFLGNSLVSIDGTSTHNVNGLTALKALYSLYRVHASRIKITACATAPTDANVLTIYPTVPGTAMTGSGVIDQPYAKWRMLANSTGQNRTHVKNYMASKKIYGQKAISQDENYVGSTSSTTGPVNSWYWQISQSGGTTDAIQYVVELELFVELFERINISSQT